MTNETIRLISEKNIMDKFYLISLSAMSSNNHLTKIMKNIGNEDCSDKKQRGEFKTE
jgi:hypothetical protein